MATYKEKVGTAVVNVAGNYPGAVDGQLWYDSTAGSYKYQFAAVTTTGSWSTGNSMNLSADGRGLGTQGTQDAALAVGGATTGGTIANTEIYNGTNWTEVNDLNATRTAMTSLGSNTATVATGGGPPAVTSTELWNGTNWTEVNNMNASKQTGNGSGTATAGLAFGGTPTPTNANTEVWNGTNWTEVNNLNSGRYSLGGAGTSTDAIAFAGSPEPSGVGLNEQWNGTNWTEVNNINTGRTYIGSAGTSTSAALGFGGLTGSTYLTITEQFNGTNWTEQNDLGTARFMPGGAGTTTAGLAYGGGIPGGKTAATEEWNVGVPIGAWSTGGNLNRAREKGASAGISNSSALYFGGSPAPAGETESYNGTNWTEVNDLNTNRDDLAGNGTQTSALATGGSGTVTELWNGTNWTEVNNLTRSGSTAAMGAAGVNSTSSLVFGGGAPLVALTEAWNGTNWTEVNDLNAAKDRVGGTGIITSALCFGGRTPGTTATNESWNGTNWTEVGDLNTARAALGAAGDNNTSALAFGGGPANTELWNGISWTEVADISQAGDAGGSNGTATSALYSGRNTSPAASTEEWNGNSKTQKTLTS